jgi:hypothetical protein
MTGLVVTLYNNDKYKFKPQVEDRMVRISQEYLLFCRDADELDL